MNRPQKSPAPENQTSLMYNLYLRILVSLCDTKNINIFALKSVGHLSSPRRVPNRGCKAPGFSPGEVGRPACRFPSQVMQVSCSSAKKAPALALATCDHVGVLPQSQTAHTHTHSRIFLCLFKTGIVCCVPPCARAKGSRQGGAQHHAPEALSPPGEPGEQMTNDSNSDCVLAQGWVLHVR